MATKKKTRAKQKAKIDNTAQRHGVSFTAADLDRVNYIRQHNETTVSGAIRAALKNYAASIGYEDVKFARH